MKTIRIEEEEGEGCGSISPNKEKSPHQEILEEQGEIFSCGGVYLGNFFEVPNTSPKTDLLHLPNHHQGVMVFKGGKMLRRSDADFIGSTPATGEQTSTGDTLRRFFRESLN